MSAHVPSGRGRAKRRKLRTLSLRAGQWPGPEHDSKAATPPSSRRSLVADVRMFSRQSGSTLGTPTMLSVDWLNALSLALAVLGMVVGAPALWLAIHAERRARERHHVDWQIAFCEHGRLRVLNRGSTARKAVAYVETSEGVELASGKPRDFQPGDEWSTELVETLLRRTGTTFFAHVRVEWETDLGTVHSICHTAERYESEPEPRYDRVPDLTASPGRLRKLFRKGVSPH